MYTLTADQTIWPILALLVFLGVFVIGVLRGWRIKSEDADRWARMALEDDKLQTRIRE